jgi:hypothetical protein
MRSSSPSVMLVNTTIKKKDATWLSAAELGTCCSRQTDTRTVQQSHYCVRLKWCGEGDSESGDRKRATLAPEQVDVNELKDDFEEDRHHALVANHKPPGTAENNIGYRQSQLISNEEDPYCVRKLTYDTGMACQLTEGSQSTQRAYVSDQWNREQRVNTNDLAKMMSTNRSPKPTRFVEEVCSHW